jgi:hypothetical protein
MRAPTSDGLNFELHMTGEGEVVKQNMLYTLNLDEFAKLLSINTLRIGYVVYPTNAESYTYRRGIIDIDFGDNKITQMIEDCQRLTYEKLFGEIPLFESQRLDIAGY